MAQRFGRRLGTFRTVRLALCALLTLATPRVALACPVCFGQNDSPMALAMNMGIFAMLGVVVAVLAAFAMFFIRLARGERLLASGSDSASVGHHPRNSYGHADPREGTVQC